MNPGHPFSRRLFLERSGATGLGLASAADLSLAPAWFHAADAPQPGADWSGHANKLAKALLEAFWRERYHLKPDGSVSPDGSQKYCESAWGWSVMNNRTDPAPADAG